MNPIFSMYEEFFRFSKRPFAAIPNGELYFPGKLAEESRRSVHRVLHRGDGIALVLGPHGAGKTLFLEKICKDLRCGECGEELRIAPVIRMNGVHLSGVVEFLRLLAHGLELPYSEKEVGELRLAVSETLTRRSDAEPGAGNVGGPVFIDDAQHVDIKVLEEIRTITDTFRPDTAALRFILAGTLSLEERLTLPRLEAFNQRITCHAYLEPFGRRETEDYIGWQIATVTTTGNPGLFPTESCNAVYQLTDGLPRLINQLCDVLLERACETEVQEIPPEMVESVWNSLQRFADTAVTNENHENHLTCCEKTSCDETIQEEILCVPTVENTICGKDAANLDFGDCDDDDLATFDLDCSGESQENRVNDFEEMGCDRVSVMEKSAELAKTGEYVYDTNTPVVLQYPCYIDKNIAMLNWVAPGHRIASGIGRAYREVAPEFRSPPNFVECKETVTPFTETENVSIDVAKIHQEYGKSQNKILTRNTSSTLNSKNTQNNKNISNEKKSTSPENIGNTGCVNKTLRTLNRENSEAEIGAIMQNTIEEEFSDVESVSRQAVPLHQMLNGKSVREYTQNRQFASVVPQDEVFAQTAERMVHLAERLEKSAGRFEQVEESIASSAQEVETHVRTIKETQPSCRELFDAISTLHETLTSELNRYTLPLDTHNDRMKPLHVFTGERRRWDEGTSVETPLTPRLCRRASLQRAEPLQENEVTTVSTSNPAVSTASLADADIQVENTAVEQNAAETQAKTTPELLSRNEVPIIKPGRIENFSVQSVSQSDTQKSAQSSQNPRKANIEFRPRKR